MTIQRLLDAIDDIAPPSLAEPWDNTGLLLGDRTAALRGPLLLTIDLTSAVLDEALEMKAAAILSYHPPIFAPLTRLTADGEKGAVLLRAARAGIAVHSPHTALDAAKDGLADWLADALEASGTTGDRRAIIPAAVADPMQTHKVVVHVPTSPPDLLERIRNGLATAGAGHVGEYDLCSFSLVGRGTFRGSAKSKPTVGERGRLEMVEEHRLEMVCPGKAVPVLIETLRVLHPFEEPAFDIYKLEGKPDRHVGAGRRVTLDQPATATDLAERVKKHLGAERVGLANAGDPRRKISRIAVCPGSGAALLEPALAQGCELFVTGEMKHHDTLAAVAQGCTVITAGHTTTERGYLPILAGRLNDSLPGLDARVSKEDRDPSRLV